MNNKELTELERIAEIHNYDTELDELLDCPFCGGRPVAFLRGNEHLNKSGKKVSVTIRCPNCRIERTDAVLKNSIEWLKEVAIKNWNNRSSVPSNDDIKREAEYRTTYAPILEKSAVHRFIEDLDDRTIYDKEELLGIWAESYLTQSKEGGE